MPLEGDARPLSKGSQLARGERRYRRQVASPRRWQQIVARKDGPCRVCGGYRESFHHLVPRGSPHFGSDTEENIVPLCGSGTTKCHGKVEGRDPKACLALALSLTDAEYSYAVERGGEGFLERRYGITYQRP